MNRVRLIRTVVGFAVALAAPAAARAADICGETVPSNRFIDGIPAYGQCAGSMTGAVYSNNGTDTATTSGGTGWVRTQGSGGYQCTELAHRYLYFKWNVTSVPNGNAGVWCDATLPSGLVKATTPVHGDLIVLAPGSCGADATTGHVGVIDVVNADTSMSVVQQNVAARSKYMMSCAACFLHVAANDGTGGDAGVPTGDASTTTDGGAGTSGAGGKSGAAGASGAGGATGRGGASGGAGNVGATGSAGTSGSGGSVATTGSAGVSGGAGTTGGGPGTAGTGPGAAPGEATGGCTVARSGDRESALLVALMTLVLVGRRRRRRQP
ncbi:MAG TPA: CHAP domain-containing protein [Polyangia bacterium]|jgi:MYXO-CTERM domain-containing protein|nr:CHAP domain-containing protein [Polyangia bacterium]